MQHSRCRPTMGLMAVLSLSLFCSLLCIVFNNLCCFIVTAKHLADGCLKASILSWRKIDCAGLDSPREARQLLPHASGLTSVEAEMDPQQARMCTLCVCQG